MGATNARTNSAVSAAVARANSLGEAEAEAASASLARVDALAAELTRALGRG